MKSTLGSLLFLQTTHGLRTWSKLRVSLSPVSDTAVSCSTRDGQSAYHTLFIHTLQNTPAKPKKIETENVTFFFPCHSLTKEFAVADHRGVELCAVTSRYILII